MFLRLLCLSDTKHLLFMKGCVFNIEVRTTDSKNSLFEIKNEAISLLNQPFQHLSFARKMYFLLRYDGRGVMNKGESKAEKSNCKLELIYIIRFFRKNWTFRINYL